MNRTEHELELMRLYLEGFASLEETKELESLIVKDASVRQDFLRYTHLDSGHPVRDVLHFGGVWLCRAACGGEGKDGVR